MTVSSLRPPLVNRYALWAIGALGAITLSLHQAGLFQQELVNPGGWSQCWQFIRASVHPDLSWELLHLTLAATLKTLAYAVCGTCFSLCIGLLGGILCSEVWWLSVFPPRSQPRSTSFWLVARALLALPRAIHELLWGLIFINLWGLDPLTAVLAIAIPFGAITAKVFAELLDETPRQPLQILLNSGVAPLTAFAYSLIPQAFLDLVSYSFYRFECSIRSAAVLGIIGAGGLGYEIFLSLQSLRYEQLWTFFYALVALNGAVDFASAWSRQRLGCVSRLDLNVKKGRRSQPESPDRGNKGATKPSKAASVETATQERNKNRSLTAKNAAIAAQTPLFLILGLLLVLLISFCFWYVNADFSKLWLAVTWQRLAEMLQACFPPDWQNTSQLGALAGDTIAMSVLAIALAALGGMLLSFPAAHNFFLPGGLLNPGQSKGESAVYPWLLLLLSRAVLLVCRAIPAPIWALVVLFVLFPGILPGAIALGLHNLGILGRLKAEVLENLSFQPLEALRAQGTPNALVFLYGVMPMTLPRFLAYSLYRWEVCMRETVIVGFVGAGGLGRVLTEQLSSFDYRGVIVTLLVFLLLTFGVDWLSGTVRRSLR